MSRFYVAVFIQAAWLLMVPPANSVPLMVPITQWIQFASFGTAADCNRQRLTRMGKNEQTLLALSNELNAATADGHRPLSKEDDEIAREFEGAARRVQVTHSAVCLASDDPFLKGN